MFHVTLPGCTTPTYQRLQEVHEAGAMHMLMPGFDVVASSHDRGLVGGRWDRGTTGGVC